MLENCHQTLHTAGRYGFIQFEDLDASEQQLIELRCGLDVEESERICLHHEQRYLKQFGKKKLTGFNPSQCSNPFSRANHSKASISGQKKISVEMSLKAKSHNIVVKPGLKICINCKLRLNDQIKASEEKLHYTSGSEDEARESYQHQKQLADANSVLKECLEKPPSVSPMTMHSVSWDRDIRSTVKRKLYQVEQQQNAAKKRIAEELSQSLNIEPDTVQLESDDLVKSRGLDEIINMIKEKLSTTESFKSKVQLLTISPPSWSINKIASTFGTTTHMARKAIETRKKGGILSVPEPKKGKPLPETTTDLVKSMYYDVEYSREMPGMKDTVSIRRNVRIPKRLLLCNLSELHAAFKKKHPDVKVGLSKFCELRPKECVTVGSSGAHSVCVCTIHQNTKLMHSALNISESLHDLTDLIVCDRENRECMLHRCEKCPGVQSMLKQLTKSYISQHLDSQACDDDEKEEFSFLHDNDIKYCQWISTDRAELEKHVLPVIDFLDKFALKLDALTAHSFITKEQNKFFKNMKETLQPNQALAIFDFAENYKFIVQDEVQSFHWNNKQCTLHPVALYLNTDGKVNEHSLCILSDDLDHDANFVKRVMDATVDCVKELSTTVEIIHYFSDGCAKQYKNCYNFYNVTQHKSDYSLDCNWHFFATSHGKNSCDGIGGAVKRTVRRASLQRPYNDQILDIDAMHDFCLEKMKSIKFVVIRKYEMEKYRQDCANRYSIARRIPGTRSFHRYIPLDKSRIECRRTSNSKAVLVFDNKK